MDKFFQFLKTAVRQIRSKLLHSSRAKINKCAMSNARPLSSLSLSLSLSLLSVCLTRVRNKVFTIFWLWAKHSAALRTGALQIDDAADAADADAADAAPASVEGTSAGLESMEGGEDRDMWRNCLATASQCRTW